MNKKMLFTLFSCLIIEGTHAISYYPFFYRTKPIAHEPRIAKKWLASVEPYLRGGHALKGYDCLHNRVYPLGIYGDENMHAIAEGVPECVLDRNPDGIINTLWQKTPVQSCFGTIEPRGKIGSAEFLLPFTQNLARGFFLSLTLPIRRVSISNMTYKDRSTPDSAGRTIDYIKWQSFSNELCENLARYGTNIGCTRNSGIGDMQLYLGWAYNYEQTTCIDFIDFTVALGINLPTAKAACAHTPYQLPLGYEKHVGLPLFVAFSCGVFDWLTAGLQGGALWFFDKTRIMPLKTSPDQRGWIRLAQDYARVKKGTIWHIDGYLKADHVINNFSLTLGFSYDHAQKTRLNLCNQSSYNHTLVNSDARHQSWTMTSLHFTIERDFASFTHPYAPRVGFTIDTSLTGKRALKNTMFGAFIGCDIDWTS
jgi:hypothetical protein